MIWLIICLINLSWFSSIFLLYSSEVHSREFILTVPSTFYLSSTNVCEVDLLSYFPLPLTKYHSIREFPNHLKGREEEIKVRRKEGEKEKGRWKINEPKTYLFIKGIWSNFLLVLWKARYNRSIFTQLSMDMCPVIIVMSYL